jgi:DNA topoisomerase IB
LSQVHVGRIRADYQADLRNNTTQLQMRATAMYLIDVLTLRAGNKEGDEADTIGCVHCIASASHSNRQTMYRANVSVLDAPFCAVYTDAGAFCLIYIARLSEQALGIIHEGA